MRLVMMGTGTFAEPTFEAHEVMKGRIKEHLYLAFDSGKKPGTRLAKEVNCDRAYTYGAYAKWLEGRK